MSEDPIFQETRAGTAAGGLLGGWYFWDETWSQRYGPYPTRSKVAFELAKYGVECLDSDPGWVYVDEETELK